ncbi:helix-turn-helix transcriptional regulator [Streptomyces sp. NPDC047043]|uniref:PadR family transcriptional regulator n=1 Tax=Streptomyces sp. NPDC047043 TaxID=3154497 RepID=UPI0033DA4767
MATLRLTTSTIAVLEVLLVAPVDSPAWGLRICRDADLGSGTVYPILDRLSERGWITSWDEGEPHPGRPPRRYYELTGAGRAQAQAALDARRARRGRFQFGLSGGSP